MTTYRIVFERQAERAFKRLPRNLAQRLDRAILKLATNPRPIGYKKLEGYSDLYRIRVGDWRIVYTIEDDQLIVLVVEISPRGGVYREL